MAKIPNDVIQDFVDVVDHHNFRVTYKSATGLILKHPKVLSIDALDAKAQARLQERLMQRISPAKRDG